MQTSTKSRLMGYYVPDLELRAVRCGNCGDMTHFPVSQGWELVGDGDRWRCPRCHEWPLLAYAPALPLPEPQQREWPAWCVKVWGLLCGAARTVWS